MRWCTEVAGAPEDPRKFASAQPDQAGEASSLPRLWVRTTHRCQG